MDAYSRLIGSVMGTAPSFEGVERAAEPGLKEQGEEQILILTNDQQVDHLDDVITSLESAGYKVTCMHPVTYRLALESSSDGQTLVGKPVSNNPHDNGVTAKANMVNNGVFEPTPDSYRIVEVVRPEDNVQEGTQNLLYVINQHDHDVKGYLLDQGHVVAASPQELLDIVQNG